MSALHATAGARSGDSAVAGLFLPKSRGAATATVELERINTGIPGCKHQVHYSFGGL
jgi:hypothetical protein